MKKNWIFANQSLFRACIVLFVVLSAEPVVAYICVWEDPEFRVVVWFAVVVWLGASSYFILANSDRIFFEADGIVYKKLFKKDIYVPYRELAYIDRAYYTSYGVRHYYLVLSNRRLTYFELTHINRIASTPHTMKIGYSKKTMAFLIETLPRKMSSQVKALFKDF